MDQMDLSEALVELTGPDGQVYQFRFGAMIPYAGEEYAVLLELEDTPEGEEQILVTRVISENGQLSFVMAEEEDVIQSVFDKYCEMTLQAAVADFPEAEE